jgi:hypothetical protein
MSMQTLAAWVPLAGQKNASFCELGFGKVRLQTITGAASKRATGARPAIPSVSFRRVQRPLPGGDWQTQRQRSAAPSPAGRRE